MGARSTDTRRARPPSCVCYRAQALPSCVPGTPLPWRMVSALSCSRVARPEPPVLDCTRPPDTGGAKPHLLRSRPCWAPWRSCARAGSALPWSVCHEPRPCHSCSRSARTPGNVPARADHPSPQHSWCELHFPDNAALRETLFPRSRGLRPLPHDSCVHGAHRDGCLRLT